MTDQSLTDLSIEAQEMLERVANLLHDQAEGVRSKMVIYELKAALILDAALPSWRNGDKQYGYRHGSSPVGQMNSRAAAEVCVRGSGCRNGKPQATLVERWVSGWREVSE